MGELLRCSAPTGPGGEAKFPEPGQEDRREGERLGLHAPSPPSSGCSLSWSLSPAREGVSLSSACVPRPGQIALPFIEAGSFRRESSSSNPLPLQFSLRLGKCVLNKDVGRHRNGRLSHRTTGKAGPQIHAQGDSRQQESQWLREMVALGKGQKLVKSALYSSFPPEVSRATHPPLPPVNS